MTAKRTLWLDDTSPSNVGAWLQRHGVTDIAYLNAHARRFEVTHRFATEALAPSSTILDIGSHWLHQAFYFANAGHRMICADHASQMRYVLKTAEAMGVQTMSYERLERGEGITELGESSVDMVLFCEVIEHITFHPARMWKAIYRALRPGGRIIVTTPNAMFHERLHAKLQALVSAGEYGIAVGDIFQAGTHGHHWKEYSIPELRSYFGRLSPDFVIARIEARAFHEGSEGHARPLADINFGAIIERLEALGCQPWEPQLLLDVAVPEKRVGIPLSAPWEI